MKKAMIFAVTLALASASAFAGTAVFNGAAMNPAFGSGAAPVFHPAQVTAGGAANFIVEPSAAGGIDITRWGGRNSFYLSATGAATNDAVYKWRDNANYTVTYTFTVEEFVRTDPPAGRFRFNPSITFAAGVWGPQNNIDLAGALHEGHKTGLEFNADSPANVVQLRVWDEGLRPFYTIPALEWPSGTPHDLSAAAVNRVPAADLVGKEITIRISRNATTLDTTWAMKIEGYGYWSVMRNVVTIPNSVNLAIGLFQDPWDTANFRFQGAIKNFTAVIEGTSVFPLNADLLGAEGVPSMATPFFTE